MIDFMAHIPKELQAKYKGLSEAALLDALKTFSEGPEHDAAAAELFRRYREEHRKVPRKKGTPERFILRREDITIIDK